MATEYKLSLTASEIDEKLNKIDNLAEKNEIPSNTSDLTNDSGFITQSYVDNKIAAIPTPDVSGQINTHNTATNSHNDIRLLVEGLTTRLNTALNSDDVNLDQMSEIVAYIKNNKTLIENVTTNKVNVSDIINNLTTNVSNKPLSAAQGVAIKALIDALDTNKVNKDYVDTQIKAIPAIPKNISAFTNDAGYVTSVPNEVYVGNDEMPQDATLQIITDATDEEQAIKDDLQYYIDGQLEIAKAEIFQMVIESLGGQPVFGYIDENNNIILNGNIANGTYTLKYENEDGSYAEIGTLTIGNIEEIKNWLNFGTTEVGGTEIYNGKGWKENTRWSASGNAPADKAGMYLTGIIPVTSGDVVYTDNLPWISSLSESVYFIRYYSNGNIDEVNLTQNSEVTPDENGVYSFDVPAYVVGVRFSCFGISDNSMITVNQYPLD